MQQVQTQNDKMVPIDTSGESVEIELKDDQKEKDSSEPEIKVEEEKTQVEEKKDTKEEELEEYSVSVKRRIDKLTKKMREAERREQAAIDFAKKVQEQNKELEKKSNELDVGYATEFEERVKTQTEVVKDNLKRALASRDNDAIVKAQEQLATLAYDQQRIKASQLDRKNQQVDVEKSNEDTLKSPTYQKPDPKAEEWAEKNEWFGKDEVMTYAAFGIHKRLIEEEGFDPKSEEYYNALDTQIRKEFPHKFEDQNRPRQKVASAVRTTSSGRRTVRLTPSQVAIAKKLGVPLEEYAKHVKEA